MRTFYTKIGDKETGASCETCAKKTYRRKFVSDLSCKPCLRATVSWRLVTGGWCLSMRFSTAAKSNQLARKSIISQVLMSNEMKKVSKKSLQSIYTHTFTVVCKVSYDGKQTLGNRKIEYAVASKRHRSYKKTE